jgi:DNA-binding transcriptional LysR family regulator
MRDPDAFQQVRVRDLVFFDRLAALGSITATARELGIPKATASRWLVALERRVGQSLVARTTRHVALTDQGRAFHDRVRDVLVAARQAQVAAQSTDPSGTIRVSVPVPLGRIVGGSVIAEFRRALPRVRLEVALQNERIDLVRDGFDLAIRGGPLPDSELIGRRLATVPMWLYAASHFCDDAPADIPIVGTPGDRELLRRRRPDLASPSVLVDDRSAVADALIQGAGAGVLPAFLGEPPRQRGELFRLDDTALVTLPVHAIYTRAQRNDPRLGVLITAIERSLRQMLDGG